MTVAKLKPCPWCGEALQEARVVEGDTFRWRKLQGCCTDGPEVHIDTLADDRVAAEERAAQAAIDTWNTRAPQWQPIESAPKDGTFILAVVQGFVPAVAKWTKEWRADGSFEFLDREMFAEEDQWLAVVYSTDAWEPTHWQPLPAPPEVEG